jgi:hypothetical protein
MLPTARFVPGGDARAASRASRPTDIPLLLLRILALLLLGAAFARPVTRTSGAALARVVIADRARGATGDVRDSAATVLRAGDRLVIADSGARIVRDGAADTLRALAMSGARGSLSAALVAARRAARELTPRADSVELVVVSPVTADEFDAATRPLAAEWPGRIRVIRTKPAPLVRQRITLVTSTPNDPLSPAVAALAGGAGVARTTIFARELTGADSALARAGGAVLHWPPLAAGTITARGVWATGVTLVAPLGRRAVDTAGTVIARWADGGAAVTERGIGSGCIRDVGVGLPLAGDLTLQPAFARFLRAVTLACGERLAPVPVADSLISSLARAGAAAEARLLRSDDESSPLAPWLVGAALLVLSAEWLARRDRRTDA